MIALLALGLVVAMGGCVFFWWRAREQAQRLDEMLDEMLGGAPVTGNDLAEGQLSALTAKARRVQERVAASVAAADAERERVKQLVSNMSHQLRTPLAGLIMYREMLEDARLDDAARQRFLAKMKGQTEKLDWLLGALFKMVDLEQGAVVFEAQSLPLSPTLTDAVAAVREKAERRELTLSVQPFEERILWHNRRWTAEVFVNLLENAVKYTAPGGRIALSVYPLELYTEIRVTDNGCGIREEELSAIFQRFYRSREVENVEGAGIGLALSRMILEHEKGMVTVRSTYGEGSTFSVFLLNAECDENTPTL